MSLITADEIFPLIPSPLSRASLQDVIDRIEAELTQKLGAPYDATTPPQLVETFRMNNKSSYLFVKRPIGSVVSILERTSLTGSDTALSENVDFYVESEEGVVERILTTWGARVVVTYVPADDRDKWKTAIIDLCRIYLSRTPLQSESVSGSHSYSAPANWDAEIQRIVKRLTFTVI